MKWLSFLLALAFVAPASSATREEIMRSRYFKYGFCMERGLNWKAGGQGGPNWMEGHKLASAMNKWGDTEPTQRAIESASPQVKKLDADCRRQNEIENEPRPR